VSRATVNRDVTDGTNEPPEAKNGQPEEPPAPMTGTNEPPEPKPDDVDEAGEVINEDDSPEAVDEAPEAPTTAPQHARVRPAHLTRRSA
jgi:hypothetical protein